MYLRFGLSYAIIIIYLVCTTSARSNGLRPPFPRRHNRRAVGLSEFLTPPAPPSPSRYRPHPPNSPYRHGKGLGSSPPPVPGPESSGFFGQFMSWLNPFGRAAPPPPIPQTRPQNYHNPTNLQSGELQPPPLPPNTHGPSPQIPQVAQYQPPCPFRPGNQPLPQPPSPPTGQSYLPPLIGKSCDACNHMPWIPMNQEVYVGSGYTAEPAGHQGYAKNPLGVDLQAPAPSHEVKTPDFGYESAKEFNQQPLNIPQPEYSSPVTGPIPNPHLYPGAIPPLFKATAFDSHSAHSGQTSQTLPYNSAGNGQSPAHETHQFQPPRDFSHETVVNNQHTQLNKPQSNFPLSSVDSHSDTGSFVDVPPPGAEIVSQPDNFPPSSPEASLHDNKGSSSDFQQVLHTSVEHETASASLTPVVQPIRPEQQKLNNENVYGTKLSSDGQHVIHIEQSPVIDLSKDDRESNDSSSLSSESSSVVDESSVALKNPDGTYGINITWPTTPPWDHTLPQEGADEFNSTDPSSSQELTPLLVQLLQNEQNDTKVTEKYSEDSTRSIQQPYGSYSQAGEESTTEESFSEALMKSYANFQKGVTEAERHRHSFDPRHLHVGAAFTPSYSIQNTNRTLKSSDRQQGAKRNKQVQIIIPYTSQYTPSPFSKNQGRKVPDSEELRTKNEEQNFSNILQVLNNLSRTVEVTSQSPIVKANTSIDVLRLQKNIDNWTIQEYSRGTTMSTASPSSLHPHLLQSKKIPDEYFTTTEPVSVAGTIQEAERAYGNVLAGFSVNDLEQEGSASNRIEVPHIKVSSSFEQEDPSMLSSELESMTPSSSSSESSSEDTSWEQLPFSISPLSNERVYVVTPQSVVSKPSMFNSKQLKNNELTKSTTNLSTEVTSKFESIEKAYQVLPEAVNNLAVASTGPATVALWGIMEHEEYAKSSNESISTSQKPILYSGHSKVSHTRQ